MAFSGVRAVALPALGNGAGLLAASARAFGENSRVLATTAAE